MKWSEKRFFFIVLFHSSLWTKLSTLLVANLSESTQDHELIDAFSVYGEVVGASVERDLETGKSSCPLLFFLCSTQCHSLFWERRGPTFCLFLKHRKLINTNIFFISSKVLLVVTPLLPLLFLKMLLLPLIEWM